MKKPLNRRDWIAQTAAAGITATAFASGMNQQSRPSERFEFNYMVSSCMYGYLYLGEILPEVSRCGARHIDIWPRPHGNQREQWADIGNGTFRRLLNSHDVSLGCITQYKLGPFGLRDEMRLAQKFGCQTMVTGGSGPRNLKGNELRSAVASFIEKMKPHLEVAEETGVTIAIENHANNLIDSPDSLKYLAELRTSKNLAIAFAPYHLVQDAEKLGDLIRDLGDAIAVFYAWEHGDGCMTRLPKHQELKQMPGRGTLDFEPLVQALSDVRFSGWTEIFMHPVPRGIPIQPTPGEVTAEINASREYLEAIARRI